MTKHDEHKLQCWLCDYLDYKLVNQGKGYYFAIPNGEQRDKDRLQAIKVGNRLKKEGLKKGVADLCVLLKDAVIFIEMKTDKGRQSPEQKEFERIVKDLGHNYIILRTIDECEQFVNAITETNELDKIIEKIESYFA